MSRGRGLRLALVLLVLPLQPHPATGAVERSGEHSFEVLAPLVETAGVSGREQPVREAILELLPGWAAKSATVDKRGNLLVQAGKGGEQILFIAHMDETGYEITALEKDGSARVRSLGGFFPTLYEAHPVIVHTRAGVVHALIRPRRDYLSATSPEQAFGEGDIEVDFGTRSRQETSALGVAKGDWLTVPKRFRRLVNGMGSGRSVDDRAGCTALIEAVRRLEPSRLGNRVTFAWSVEEETGLKGADALAATTAFDVVFAVDTFVSSDSPLESKSFALAILGQGPVLRAMDNSNLAPAEGLQRIEALAKAHHLPLQIGLTHGGNDGSVFTSHGALDLPLSWPTTYSHSAVEVIHEDDLNKLGQLVALLAEAW